MPKNDQCNEHDEIVVQPADCGFRDVSGVRGTVVPPSSGPSCNFPKGVATSWEGGGGGVHSVEMRHLNVLA